MTINNHESSDNSNFVFFAIVGAIFVIVAVGLLLWLQNFSLRVNTEGGLGFHSGRRIKMTPAPLQNAKEGAPEVAASASGAVNMEAVIAAINKGGCIACHTIPNIPGAVGVVGPNLSKIGLDGATRRDGYTAQEYIRESLMDPSAFTAPECPTGPCPPGVMPQLLLDQSEIDTIVSYLVTLGVSE